MKNRIYYNLSNKRYWQVLAIVLFFCVLLYDCPSVHATKQSDHYIRPSIKTLNPKWVAVNENADMFLFTYNINEKSLSYIYLGEMTGVDVSLELLRDSLFGILYVLWESDGLYEIYSLKNDSLIFIQRINLYDKMSEIEIHGGLIYYQNWDDEIIQLNIENGNKRKTYWPKSTNTKGDTVIIHEFGKANTSVDRHWLAELFRSNGDKTMLFSYSYDTRQLDVDYRNLEFFTWKNDDELIFLVKDKNGKLPLLEYSLISNKMTPCMSDNGNQICLDAPFGVIEMAMDPSCSYAVYDRLDRWDIAEIQMLSLTTGEVISLFSEFSDEMNLYIPSARSITWG